MQAVRKHIVEDALSLRLLGAMSVTRGECDVSLPKSRKVRALLAYLILAPRAITRTHLCELLWDSPSDPRGELRWCLSKIRGVLDTVGHSRVIARDDAIAIDLEDASVDALEVTRSLQEGVGSVDLGTLRALASRFGGELLDGLHIDDSPHFNQWLAAERRRLRTLHASVLEALVRKLPHGSSETLDYLEQWLQVDPFERSAHELLLETLVSRGRLREAEAHLGATIRQFELEGLEWLSIREAWRAARNRARQADLRLVAPASAKPVRVTAVATVDAAPQPARRGSICVLPFRELHEGTPTRGSVGDGLADDIITRLAKLRVLFVIARGTAFSLMDRNADRDEIGRLLGVDYLVSGSVRRRNGRLLVRVELTEAQRPRIVWSDELECAADDALSGLESIGHGIVASIADEVETAERNRAMLKTPASLDAWEAYHRGLWHIYRFNGADNDRAEHFFRQSTQLDPTFARAHAGLSFAHFQNAFLHRPDARQEQIDLAYESAGQSLMADDRDPAAHWAMGRALWLRGEESESVRELSACVDLSPNFALGHYTLGFVQAQSGDPRAAIESVAHSRALSPFDPLLFAMLATHAMAHARLGEYDVAADWSAKAAARPNAHTHVVAIAAHCLALAGRLDEARSCAARVRATNARYDAAEFLGAFRFTPDAQALFRSAARQIGFA